jgi:S-formylglutathione hydrolase FrmB
VRTSLVDPPFLAGLGALTASVVVAAAALRRRPLLRRLVAAAAAVLLLASTAAGVNAYFDYIPTVGALTGRRAADQATPAQVVRAIRAVALPTHGLVERVDIPAPVSHFRARPAQVYLPPAWFASPRPALPVVELLHGTPGTPEDWTRAGQADLVADRWAATHGGVAPILLMPDVNGSFTADTECVDGPRGAAETYLSVDVPNWAEATLGAPADPGRWAVAGASEGGYCALVLALRHPERFGALADFAGLDRPTARGGVGRLFARSLRRELLSHSPYWLLAHPRPGRRPAAWFEVGGADGATTRAVVRAARAARRHGLVVEVRMLPHAHHTWRVFRRAFDDAFPWLVARVTPPGVSARRSAA